MQEQADINNFQIDFIRIFDETSKVIVGQQAVIRETLLCLLCGGHALLEGVPGLGKTLLVRTLGAALDLSFSRIQFTPDLMPADITGCTIVTADERGGKAFEFQEGPVFANLVLADEINRATPKTQSALLEAMQEQTVTTARATRKLPLPFFVLATQNPLEQEGTYPLPEAQLDRFFFKVNVPSVDAEQLVAIMDRTTGTAAPQAQKVATAGRVQEMQRLVRQVPVAQHIKQYIAAIVLATHPAHAGAPELARKYVRYGASPRGAQAIILAAKALALVAGRANVAFDDVAAVVAPALRHRLILNFEGQADGIDADQVIAQVLATVPRGKEV